MMCRLSDTIRLFSVFFGYVTRNLYFCHPSKKLETMNRFILLFSLLLATVVVSAQTNMDEVVYLKDGSSVRGLIIEMVPGTSISICDQKGTMHDFAMSAVAKIRRESRPKPPKPPFYAAIEVGLTDFPIPKQLYKKNIPLFSVNVIGGVKAAKKFYTGIGFGADVYGQRTYHLSAYWHMRAFFTDKRIAPYFELNAGYNGLVYNSSIGYSRYYYPSSHQNGGMVNPSVGVKIAVATKVAVTVSAGYKFVVFSGSDASRYYYSNNYDPWGHAVTLRAGVAF